MGVKRLWLAEKNTAIEFFSKIFEVEFSSCNSWFIKKLDDFLTGKVRVYQLLEGDDMIGCAVIELRSDNKATLEAFGITNEKYKSEAIDKLCHMLKTFEFELVVPDDGIKTA